MRVTVNGVRLFFDVKGASLVPDGPSMREKPTLTCRGAGCTRRSVGNDPRIHSWQPTLTSRYRARMTPGWADTGHDEREVSSPVKTGASEPILRPGMESQSYVAGSGR